MLPILELPKLREASASKEALVSITSASTVVSASQDGAGAAASAAGAAASDKQKSINIKGRE